MQILSKLNPAKILVVGDFMLDAYTIGKVRRISPEAPVAIVNVEREEYRAGGAGNVVLNLVSMGAEVVAVGRIGSDSASEKLRSLFAAEGLTCQGLFLEKDYAIPVKNRVIAENQQIVRIDHETITPISQALEQHIIDALPFLLEGVKVVAISDYGKGFLSRTLIQAIIAQAKLSDVPVIADPKGLDFSRYAKATIIKPNLSELYAAAGMPLDSPLDVVAAKVLALSEVEMLIVTRSEDGITIFYADGSREDFVVKIQEVKDVTGAGDTVLAMLAMAIGNRLLISEAVELANVAAGIAIGRFGCARITLSDVACHLVPPC